MLCCGVREGKEGGGKRGESPNERDMGAGDLRGGEATLGDC